jgi:hypothetical protein
MYVVLSRVGKTVLQWAFKLHSDLAAADNWHLKGHKLKVNERGYYNHG